MAKRQVNRGACAGRNADDHGYVDLKLGERRHMGIGPGGRRRIARYRRPEIRAITRKPLRPDRQRWSDPNPTRHLRRDGQERNTVASLGIFDRTGGSIGDLPAIGTAERARSIQKESMRCSANQADVSIRWITRARAIDRFPAPGQSGGE